MAEEPVVVKSGQGLLVLRAEALLLFLTFGLGKLIGLILRIASDQPLSTWGIAKLIAGVGLPAAGLLAAFVALSESIAAVLIVIGWFTRTAAACAALAMAGALYYSLGAGEEPLRAAVYVVVFAALALTGPGRCSIDRTTYRVREGLLVLRIGLAISTLLLFALPQAGASEMNLLLLIVIAAGTLVVAIGIRIRVAAAATALAWLVALGLDLAHGVPWFNSPTRAAEFAIAFAALAVASVAPPPSAARAGQAPP
jgi:uncharacterized membrane protein YphA (DoxX/SURF4 family)